MLKRIVYQQMFSRDLGDSTVDFVVFFSAGAQSGACDLVSRKHSPRDDAKRVPRKVDETSFSVP